MRGESDKTERFLRHLEPLRGALEAFCRRHVNDPNAVEDVLQSAVAGAFRDFHLYVENTNFRAWIFRYVNLEILSWNRRRRPTAGPGVVEEAEAAESWEGLLGSDRWEELQEAPELVLEHCGEELSRAVGELPNLERSALLLRAIGEFKYREIAEILEVPVGSVMGYLGRARATLRRRLAEYCRHHGFPKEGGR